MDSIKRFVICGLIVLPSLTKDQVEVLISSAHCTRDKAIISLFTESGLRWPPSLGQDRGCIKVGFSLSLIHI